MFLRIIWNPDIPASLRCHQANYNKTAEAII